MSIKNSFKPCGPLYTRVVIFCLLGFAVAGVGRAHFPWLAVDENRHALYWFGENLSDRTYHLPPALASTPVHLQAEGEPSSAIEMVPHETDSFVGRRSASPVPEKGQLRSEVVYGIYHGSKLTYSSQMILGDDAGAWPTQPTEGTELQVVLAAVDGGIVARVYWQGRPLADSKVQLLADDGSETQSAVTDADGRVQFDAGDVKAGLNALMVGQTLRDRTGQHEGEAYKGEAHYLTVTFQRPSELK